MAKRPVTASNDQAYKGYLIRYQPMSGGYWIEKGGFTVQNYVASPTEAKAIIDMLDRG